MREDLTISKQKSPFPDYLDFQSLRKKGIEHLQELSGNIWTDYNLHDPGVSLLEVLCYAITDLGYRNNLDIKDLLAPNPNTSNELDDNFFTPDQILTCNPVTILDMRKRLVDIPGIRNAWVKIKEDSYNPSIYVKRNESKLQYTDPNTKPASEEALPLPLHIKGLYTVLLDLAPDVRKDACGQNSLSWGSVFAEAKAVLHSYRNLCEDIYEIKVLDEEKIALQANIELDTNADAENILVEIYVRVQNFLAPYVKFYTLQELLDRGKRPDEIFAGRPSALPRHDLAISPALAKCKSHGFIDPDELEALILPEVIYTSDFYQLILDIPGIVAIRELGIASFLNGLQRSQFFTWFLHPTKGYRPVLDIENSKVNFVKQGYQVIVNDPEKIDRRYQQQQIIHLKAQRDAYELDLAIPTGTHLNIADHYAIHHELPIVYGVGDDGLPEPASTERQAKAKQLKAYLAFFDQILANYLSQLAQVRSLFSWDESKWIKNGNAESNGQQHTYAAQMLNFPGVEEIIKNYQEADGAPQKPNSYAQLLQSLVEDRDTANQRRNHFLDHLLARFAETFTNHTLLQYGKEKSQETDIIHNKACFLKNYPAVSRDRFRAMNYSIQFCNQDRSFGISGFQRRIERLLGIETEQVYILEHILLRPTANAFMDFENGSSMLPKLLPIYMGSLEAAEITSEAGSVPATMDPYSFWVSVLLPAGEGRFQDREFRQLVEQTMRLEAPAHIALKIGWLAPAQMQEFKTAYDNWLNQLRISATQGHACGLNSARDRLVKFLSELKSDVFKDTEPIVDDPLIVLADSQGKTTEGNKPFVLDKSFIRLKPRSASPSTDNTSTT